MIALDRDPTITPDVSRHAVTALACWVSDAECWGVELETDVECLTCLGSPLLLVSCDDPGRLPACSDIDEELEDWNDPYFGDFYECVRVDCSGGAA